MHIYLAPLPARLTAAADPTQAGPMSRYMRDQFPFLGVKTPVRRAAWRQFTADYGPPPTAEPALTTVVRDLWQLPEREYQYIAVDLLSKLSEKKLSPSILPLLEELVINRSWWDTVDGLSHVVGNLFLRHPASRDEWIGRWRTADNFWLRRITLLFQLHYKTDTDEALLFDLVRQNSDSAEFFIQKAIGWALREHAKCQPAAVRHLVHTTPLAPLSQREALKRIGREP